MSEREQLTNTLQTLNKEIAVLRDKLDQVGKQREEWFQRKENLKRRVANLISKTKEVRELRDHSAKEMIEITKRRDETNAKVSELVKKYNDLYYERNKLFKQHNIKYTPEKLKSNIQYYETQIETEALSFKKELKLMEYIKQLKKIYDQTKVASDVLKHMNVISAEINEHKKKSSEFHSKVYECYYKNRQSKKDFKNLSYKITNFNFLQEEAFNMFVKLKEEYASLNKTFKDKLTESARISRILHQAKKDIEHKKEESVRKIIEEKQKTAVEKFRSKKKLTNEDLLAFQGK